MLSFIQILLYKIMKKIMLHVKIKEQKQYTFYFAFTILQRETFFLLLFNTFRLRLQMYTPSVSFNLS